MVANLPLHFYKPKGNNYHAPMHLWCIAREDRSHPQSHWLETHWIGTGRQDGLALFVSKLDANIQCIYMNATTPKEKGKKEWKAYPFSDLNRHEMVTNMKFNYGRDHFNFCFVFGFLATRYNQITTRKGVFRPISFHESFLMQDFLDHCPDSLLELSTETFEEIESIWREANVTFDDIRESNAMSDPVITKLALKAFKEMNYIPSEKHQSAESEYTEIGTYILRHGWTFTSFYNPQPKELKHG